MARAATYDREAVLGLARDLFWAKGYHATSLKDLESALDMRPGSIYAAFSSKEGLFAAALDDYARRSLADAEEAMAAAPSPLAGLAAHVRALGACPLSVAPSRACMLVKTILEMPDDGSPLRIRAEAALSRMEALFTARFVAAQEAGELPPGADPVRLGRRFQASVIGLRAYAQRTDGAAAVSDIAEDIARDIEALRRPV